MALFGIGGSANTRAYQQQVGTEGDIDVGARANQREARNRFTGILEEGQPALEESVRSAVSSAMPEFRKGMQDVQESEIQRGIGLGGGTGSLGTSYEGDLESAFNRNIANAAGSQALSLYNTRVGGAADLYGTDTEAAMFGRNRYMNILSGQANADRRRKAGLFGTLGAIGGFALGGAVGGKAGESVGSEIGGMFGGAVGSQ